MILSDDNEGAGEDGGPAPSAPADPLDDGGQVDLAGSSVPSNGDDIVVCGPVEEIDVDVEMPTKDVDASDTVLKSPACDPVIPSKKTKKKKSRIASKPCKLTIGVISYFWTEERAPSRYERCSCYCWGSCCYHIFKVLKFFLPHNRS